MPSLGITGGIAGGKSIFTRALARFLPASVFDSDQVARELLKNDEAVRRAVRDEFGPEMFTPGGELDREKMRAMVFADAHRRKALEAILHPPIRRRWTGLAAKVMLTADWLVVDIPLLYETHAESHFNTVVVVACPRATQIRRLTQRRGLDRSMAEKMIASQLDVEVKMQKASHVVWNDGLEKHLEEQAALLAEYLKQKPFQHDVQAWKSAKSSASPGRPQS